MSKAKYPLTSVSMPVVSVITGEKTGTSVKRVGPRPGSRSKKMTHVQDTKSVDISYASLGALRDDVLAWIEECGESGVLNHDHSEWRGDYWYISYWREMTPEEKKAHAAQQEAAQERLAMEASEEGRRDKAALMRLRQQHPDWLTPEKRSW